MSGTTYRLAFIIIILLLLLLLFIYYYFNYFNLRGRKTSGACALTT